VPQPTESELVIKDNLSLLLRYPYPLFSNLTFQWEGHQGDGVWAPLQESNLYTGVNSSRLTINQPENNMVGWQYRIQVGDPYAACATFAFGAPITLVSEGLNFPNAFSPNGDGINDTWEITGVAAFPNNKLFIYNRWEQKVFEESNYQNNWNGTSNIGNSLNANELPNGVYFYLFEESPGGTRYKGFIYLKR